MESVKLFKMIGLNNQNAKKQNVYYYAFFTNKLAPEQKVCGFPRRHILMTPVSLVTQEFGCYFSKY